MHESFLKPHWLIGLKSQKNARYHRRKLRGKSLFGRMCFKNTLGYRVKKLKKNDRFYSRKLSTFSFFPRLGGENYAYQGWEGGICTNPF